MVFFQAWTSGNQRKLCRFIAVEAVQGIQYNMYSLRDIQYKLQNICTVQCTILGCAEHCTVYRICSKLYSLQDVQNTVQFTGYTVNCTVNSICGTLYIFKIYSTLYRLWDIQCTLFCKYYIYSAPNTVQGIQYYTVHCSGFTVHSILNSRFSSFLAFSNFPGGAIFSPKKGPRAEPEGRRSNVPNGGQDKKTSSK